MNKIRKIIGCAALCMTVTAQTAFAEQMQVVFYGKTTAYKQISVLALDKDLPGSEIKEQNIKYINQVSSGADGNYSSPPSHFLLSGDSVLSKYVLLPLRAIIFKSYL